MVALVAAVAVGVFLVARQITAGNDTSLPEPEPELATEVGIGEEVRDGSFRFTVTRFHCDQRHVGVPPITRAATGRFCLVELRVRNEGVTPDIFDGSAQFLIDSASRKHLPASALGGPQFGPPISPVGDLFEVAPGLRELTLVTLNPGGMVEGVLVFDLPQEVTASEVELHGVPFFAIPGPGVRVRLN